METLQAAFCQGYTRRYLAIDNNDIDMIGPMGLLARDEVALKCKHYLKDLVLHGRNPFEVAHGKQLFEYMDDDLRFKKVFHEGMTNHSTATMRAILDNYTGFEGLNTIVDVGGGLGASLNMIVKKYPNVHGINFDLPNTVMEASPLPGIEHIGGDMFKEIPKGDAIFMKWILHDWNDETCIKLLKNCYKSLPDQGKVIIAEYILPETPESNLTSMVGYQLDLDMATICQEGKERTEREFDFLRKEADFTKLCVRIKTMTSISIIEMVK